MTVLGALRKVVEQEGVFCALYSDRASHFFWTPRAGGKVDPERLTQVGRALKVGSAFLPCQRKDLDVLFSVQQTRVVSRDNTVVVGGKTLQIGATRPAL